MPGRGAAGKTVVAGAVESGRGKGRGRRLGRLRLQSVTDASAKSLEEFLEANVAKPAEVATDGWSGYRGLPAKGYDHQPVNLATGSARSAKPVACPSRACVGDDTTESVTARWAHRGTIGRPATRAPCVRATAQGRRASAVC